MRFVHPLCEAQHVHGAEGAGLDGLDGVILLQKAAESLAADIGFRLLLSGTCV